MKTNIKLSNLSNEIDVGNGNFVKQYDGLDLAQVLNSDTPVISIQKSTTKIIENILDNIGIIDGKKNSLESLFGRSGYLEIVTKDFGKLGLLLTKGSDSAFAFSQLSDYYFGGNDIGENIQARGVKLKEIGKIVGEELWKYKTELLLIIGLNSINRVTSNGGDLFNFELDMITTKFTPTITSKAINKLPVTAKKPGIITVDSNSELAVQLLELSNINNVVGGVEIVQSGSSLIATQNAFVRDNQLILPSMRNLSDGGFYGDVISDIDSESQVGKIASSIQTEINLSLYKILNNDEKPREFVNKILKNMK